MFIPGLTKEYNFLLMTSAKIKMALFLHIFLSHLAFTGIVWASQLQEMEKPVPVRNVEAVLGGVAELPCDILPEDAHDDVYLVLWFKANATKPMYSLDVRGKPLNQASHWAESSALGRRTSFRTQVVPNSLLVEDLTLQDEGIYRCRVDYRNSPTKNVKLNLSIIVPPNEPVVRNQNGQELATYEIGPYEVGQKLILDCEVSGGNPLPKVTWWHSGVIFDSTDEIPRKRGGSIIVNTMVYKSLTREDLFKVFVCQASNTNRTLPVSRKVKVVLNLKPSSVTILEKPSFVSAGREIKVVCQSLSGYPPPKLTWWLGSKMLKSNEETASNGVSKSVLLYEPTIEDDGRYLTCRAENAALRNTAMEDQWTIQVHYSPQVSLRLGRTLDANNIRTGHDVYFECDVKSNPKPLRLEWLHNGRILEQDTSKGIIMSTQSLVLQHVEVDDVGAYTCRAVNSEGAGESNSVPLKIMYAPICQSQLVDQLIGVTAEESISINCRVDAYPAAVTFSWFFNNSEHQQELDEERFTTNNLVSTLNFAPTTNQDYGTLFCLGENAVGHQDEPCAFKIVPTGRPAPLSECRILNMSQPSIKVGCQEGFDGGLPQTFLLEVYENEQLKTKMTNQQPFFEISQVDYGQPVKLFVFAQNAKGSSEPFIIEETFGKARQQAVEGVTDSKAVKGSSSMLDWSSYSETASPSHILVIVSGIAAGLVLTVLLVCLFVTCRRKNRRNPSSGGGRSGGDRGSPSTSMKRKLSSNSGTNGASCPLASDNGYESQPAESSSTRKIGRQRTPASSAASQQATSAAAAAQAGLVVTADTCPAPDSYGNTGHGAETTAALGVTTMADLDSSSLLLASRRTSAKGTLVQVPSSHGGGGADWPPRHSQHQLRISSQDALLDSSGNGSSQLVIETGGAIGGQFMHHDWPLPSQGGRAQFASIVGGTLGRAGPRGGVPNVYPIQGAPVVANSSVPNKRDTTLIFLEDKFPPTHLYLDHHAS